MTRILQAGLLLALTATLLTQPARSGPAVFTINPAQSQLSVSGNVVAFGSFSAPLTAQQANSLTATYEGSINATLAGSTIQFMGASLIMAEDFSSPVKPGLGGGSGTAAADYGGVASKSIVTAYVAARNVVFNLVSPVLTETNGVFNSSTMGFSFPTNDTTVMDYTSSIESGSDPMTGTAYNTASGCSVISTNGELLLTLPVNMTFEFSSGTLTGTTLQLVGQLVATNAPAPVISSIVETNNSIVLQVQYATTSSQILVSTNLTSWSASTATGTNLAGTITFTLPTSGGQEFFRAQQ